MAISFVEASVDVPPTATLSTFTVVLSAVSQVGDIVLLRVTSHNNGAGYSALTTPPGWTVENSLQIRDGSAYYAEWIVSHVIAAGDIGATVSGFSLIGSTTGTGSFHSVTHATYRGVGASSGFVDAISFVSSIPAGGTTQASLAVTTSVPNDMVVEFWTGLSASGTLTTPASARAASGLAGVSDRIIAAAGADSPDTASVSPSRTIIPASVALLAPQNPAAPTLTSPTNASYVDLSGTPTFTWTFNPASGSSATQNGYALRSKINGAGSYNYWNAATASWQSTIVWNLSTLSTVTFPAGAWANGNIYNWSVATQGTVGNLQGAFASDFTVTGQAPPVPTVTAPTGVQGSFTPNVTWSESLPVGATQTAYRVVIYSAAQYTAGGFAPGSGSNLADSGVVSSSAMQWSIPLGSLSNNTTCRAYVQLTESGGEVGGWAFATFTVSVDTPAPPIVTVTPGTDGTTGAPIVTCAVQGTDNLLSVDDASFELSIGSWTVGANCALAQSAAQSVDGGFSLAMTASAAGDMYASSGQYAVVPLKPYAATANLRASAAGRTVRSVLTFVDASHGFLSSVTGSNVTDTTTGWTVAGAAGAAPAGAAYAYLTVYVVAAVAGGVHYVDQAGIRPGTDPTWYRGGLVGTVSALLQSSDDGGTTWVTVRNAGSVAIPAGTQLAASVSDFELIPGTARQYRAQAQAVVGGPATIVSPWSTVVSATASTAGAWWLVVPLQPSLSMAVDVTDDAPVMFERAAAHYGVGATYPTVFADTVGGLDGQLTIETHDDTTYAAFLALVRAQQVVWLMSPMVSSGSIAGRYVRLSVPPGSGGGSSGGNTAHSGKLEPSPAATPVRVLTFTYVQMARP